MHCLEAPLKTWTERSLCEELVRTVASLLDNCITSLYYYMLCFVKYQCMSTVSLLMGIILHRMPHCFQKRILGHCSIWPKAILETA